MKADTTLLSDSLDGFNSSAVNHLNWLFGKGKAQTSHSSMKKGAKYLHFASKSFLHSKIIILKLINYNLLILLI